MLNKLHSYIRNYGLLLPLRAQLPFKTVFMALLSSLYVFTNKFNFEIVIIYHGTEYFGRPWQRMLLFIPSNVKFVIIMSSCYLELFFFIKVQKPTIEKYTFNAKILYKRILHVTTVTKAFILVEKTYFPYLTNITSMYSLFQWLVGWLWDLFASFFPATALLPGESRKPWLILMKYFETWSRALTSAAWAVILLLIKACGSSSHIQLQTPENCFPGNLCSLDKRKGGGKDLFPSWDLLLSLHILPPTSWKILLSDLLVREMSYSEMMNDSGLLL